MTPLSSASAASPWYVPFRHTAAITASCTGARNSIAMSILTLFKSRSRPADRFEQLVSPYINVLYRFAFRLCQCVDGAEELVQLLLTRLFSRVDELEQVENLRPWLMRSLYNLYIDSYRKQQRMFSVISPEAMPEETVSAEKMPDEVAETGQHHQILLTAMQQLNDEQRVVMMLHDGEGYTLTELSDILQTPLGTLKSRLHRARNTVRELTAMELSDAFQRVRSKEEAR